jgi:FMN-dependent NADH-azoreductase
MPSLLVINSSVSGAGSVSRALVEKVVAHLTAEAPGTVVELELGDDPVPHLTGETVAGVRAVPATAAEHAARSLSDKLIGQVRAADIIVVGAPMYNFGLPTGLKAWFDHVLRPGETFSYSEAGPKGLIEGKRVIVVVSRGGFYSDGPYKPFDFQEPYIRVLFGFIGLTDVTFIRAEALSVSAEAREQAISAAEREIAQLAHLEAVAAA